MMPLLAREMRVWLKGSSDRVAVLHCKGMLHLISTTFVRTFLPLLAGKGRSGTMACAYLLSLDDSPAPPKLERSYSAKQWAKRRADNMMEVVPEDADDDLTKIALTPDALDKEDPVLNSESSSSQAVVGPLAGTAVSTKSFADSLKDVLDLHTSRRMKAPTPGKKAGQGVSIPSQRRYLYYWTLLLAYEAPAHFWAIPRPPMAVRSSKVRLTQIALRMRGMSTVVVNLVRAANLIIDHTGTGKKSVYNDANGKGQVWASLARYDDEFVELLESWEKHTRDEKILGCRRPGSEYMGDRELNRVFEDGRWDRGKMVRPFARLGAVGDAAAVKSEANKVGVHT